MQLGFPDSSEDKASACNAGDLGLIPGSGRSPGEGNGNPLQYSCLENPMDGGAWWSTVHGVTKSWTRLSDFTFTLNLVERKKRKSEVSQSCPTLCDPWTVDHQAPPSMGFSRQEYWSGLPFPSPGDLSDPG